MLFREVVVMDSNQDTRLMEVSRFDGVNLDEFCMLTCWTDIGGSEVCIWKSSQRLSVVMVRGGVVYTAYHIGDEYVSSYKYVDGCCDFDEKNVMGGLGLLHEAFNYALHHIPDVGIA